MFLVTVSAIVKQYSLRVLGTPWGLLVILLVIFSYTITTVRQRNMDNQEERHDLPRSCRNELSKKRYGIHKAGYNKKGSHKKRTRNICNTRCETQIQTKLDQPPWKNGQHQTPVTCAQLQTTRKKRSWTPEETMTMRWCWNRSNDLIHWGRWWWWLLVIFKDLISFWQLLFPITFL